MHTSLYSLCTISNHVAFSRQVVVIFTITYQRLENGRIGFRSMCFSHIIIDGCIPFTVFRVQFIIGDGGRAGIAHQVRIVFGFGPFEVFDDR